MNLGHQNHRRSRWLPIAARSCSVPFGNSLFLRAEIKKQWTHAAAASGPATVVPDGGRPEGEPGFNPASRLTRPASISPGPYRVKTRTQDEVPQHCRIHHLHEPPPSTPMHSYPARIEGVGRVAAKMILPADDLDRIGRDAGIDGALEARFNDLACEAPGHDCP
jgi:hypothetical protein